MTYAYDRDAMAQPSTLDPFRVATTLGFQHTHDDDDTMIDASTIVLTGPRGAEEFARMWAAHCATGQRTARLDSILRITIGDARTVRAQRQMIGILRRLRRGCAAGCDRRHPRGRRAHDRRDHGPRARRNRDARLGATRAGPLEHAV